MAAVLLSALVVSGMYSEPLAAAEYHVSPTPSANGQGTETSPWSLEKANAAVEPGDVVVLHGGTYRTPIQPATSGRPGRPISFRATKGETPRITEVEVGIDLRSRSYISVAGVAVEKVEHFLWAERCGHLTIVDCVFDTAPGWESCRLRQMGDGVHVRDCTFRNGSDLLSIEGGNYHLIEGNVFDTAGHTCLVLMGVQRSVVRKNRLRNPIQKLMEVFSTRARQHPDPQRISQYLVIEENVFEYSAGERGFAGIQYAGNKSILRRNIFRNCGIGMNWTGYDSKQSNDNPEAFYNRHNRFYNNIVYECGHERRGAGILLATAVPDFGDQIHVNNIIFGNRCGRKDTAASVQVFFGWDSRPEHARFIHNDIVYRTPGEPLFALRPDPPNRQWMLSEYESAYPELAFGNIEQDPLFVDPEAGDFRLQAGSPCIDAGAQLTRTSSAGTGRLIEVEDPLFFSDGHGVVEPDIIRVGNRLTTVVKVEAESGRIEVKDDLSWEKGAPVSLDYAGSAPDIGAFEFGLGSAE